MKKEITLPKILLLVGVVFTMETVVMFALFRVEVGLPWIFRYNFVEALADSVLLSALIAPFIYKLLVQPMQISNSMKSRVLDMVSDQLRNPLGALQGLEAVGRQSSHDEIEKARSNALRMLQLRIDYIVAFSALQADELLTCNNVKTLDELIKEARRRIAFVFEASGTGLNIADCNPDVALGIIDAETLLHIVMSMLEIAMMTPGSKNVALRTEILVQSKRRTRARIIVTHDGNEHANSVGQTSNDRIEMFGEIASHMALRIGARLRMGRGRTQILEITVPTQAATS